MYIHALPNSPPVVDDRKVADLAHQLQVLQSGHAALPVSLCTRPTVKKGVQAVRTHINGLTGAGSKK
eukprot:358715-Chlamydomonas_euryale.AAC.6